VSTWSLSNEEVKVAMAEMENTYSEVAEAFINDADWSTGVPGLKLGGGDQHQHIKLALSLEGNGMFVRMHRVHAGLCLR
jgi:hypothetical protein